jgi:hypothetical protein
VVPGPDLLGAAALQALEGEAFARLLADLRGPPGSTPRCLAASGVDRPWPEVHREELERTYRELARRSLGFTRVYVGDYRTGLVFDEKGLVAGIDGQFLEYLDLLAGTAARHRLTVMLSFTDNTLADGKGVEHPEFIADLTGTACGSVPSSSLPRERRRAVSLPGLSAIRSSHKHKFYHNLGKTSWMEFATISRRRTSRLRCNWWCRRLKKSSLCEDPLSGDELIRLLGSAQRHPD